MPVAGATDWPIVVEYSLALSLGRKRAVTAECEDQLTSLSEALAKHESRATR